MKTKRKKTTAVAALSSVLAYHERIFNMSKSST
jgi:hypothetical protein